MLPGILPCLRLWAGQLTCAIPCHNLLRKRSNLLFAEEVEHHKNLRQLRIVIYQTIRHNHEQKKGKLVMWKISQVEKNRTDLRNKIK